MIKVSICNNILNDVFVFFGHVLVNRFHEAGEFAVERLYLLLVNCEETLIIVKKILCGVGWKPFLLKLPLDLGITHLLFVLITEIVLGLDDNTILNKCLVLFIKDTWTNLYLIKAIIIIVLTLLLALLILLFVEVYLWLG
jgi:hypothetical protein